jgi:hypothetical protein
MEPSGAISLNTSGPIEVNAGGPVSIDAPLINLGVGGLPVARVGDKVAGGVIITGCPTVLAG